MSLFKCLSVKDLRRSTSSGVNKLAATVV